MGNICIQTNRKYQSMGISRDSRHKRRLTGGRMPIHKKKRQFECGKPPANTKLAEKRIRQVRTRGGSIKLRALRLNLGNFVWQSEGIARKSKIVNVVYNAVSNELVRTNTLTKNTIVYIDATPFQRYVLGHYQGLYGDNITREQKIDWNWENKEDHKDLNLDKNNKDVRKAQLNRRLNTRIEQKQQEMLSKGALLACISSRPGQCGRADGYILEGKELEFYLKKIPKKKA